MAEDGRLRRWYTLSLRTMLLVVGLVAVFLGWWFNSAREQQAAVAAIRVFDTAANLWYDDERLEDKLGLAVGRTESRQQSLKSWLEKRLGRDYFHNVVTLAFGQGPADAGVERRGDIVREVARLRGLDQLELYIPVSDDDVAQLSGLRRLKRLGIDADSPRLSDASLRVISRLRSLESLVIRSASITDAGLSHLGRMPRLEALALGKAKPFDRGDRGISLTGAGLGELAHLPALVDLEIHSEALTSEGLRQVGTLRHLKRLRLKGGAFRDADLRFLAGLAELESLDIVGASIDGTGFEHLTGLSKLTYVCLEGQNVTDAAIPFLAQLPALKSLMIYGTHVTTEGLLALRTAHSLKQMGLIPAVGGDTKQLKQALPGCSVLNDGKSL